MDMDDGSTRYRKCVTTTGENLEELLYCTKSYTKCGAALQYEASDYFANADCIFEGRASTNYDLAHEEINNLAEGLDENSVNDWNRALRRLHARCGVTEDEIEDFLEYVKGLKKPMSLTNQQFDNRVEALLSYWQLLSGHDMQEAELLVLRKKRYYMEYQRAGGPPLIG